jgi:hypothetical protein
LNRLCAGYLALLRVATHPHPWIVGQQTYTTRQYTLSMGKPGDPNTAGGRGCSCANSKLATS